MRSMIPTDAGERWLLGLATGALLLGLGVLAVAGGVGILRHEPRIGHVVDGEARRREANDFQWRLVGADTPVYLHDTIRTPKTGSVTVALENGRRMEIPANTVLRLDDMRDLRVEVTVLAGRFAESDGLVVRYEAARRRGAMLAAPQLPLPR